MPLIKACAEKFGWSYESLSEMSIEELKAWLDS